MGVHAGDDPVLITYGMKTGARPEEWYEGSNSATSLPEMLKEVEAALTKGGISCNRITIELLPGWSFHEGVLQYSADWL